MDYKEKYKEALERATQLSKQGGTHKYLVCKIFPELKESDERIRKAIFKALSKKDARDVLLAEGVLVSDALAWLEKQCNKMPEECVYRPLAGCDINSAAKQAIKQQGVLAKKIVLAFNGAYIPVEGKNADDIVNEYNSWLEKQGEPQPQQEALEALRKLIHNIDASFENIQKNFHL